MLAIILGVFFSVTTPEKLPAEIPIPADTVKRNFRNRELPPDSARAYITINRIIILGNKLTRNSIILRELSLQKGDVVNAADLNYFIEKDQRKLFNLHLFNTATIQPLDYGNNTVDLLVEVDERWYTFPVPIFQLSDRNFNEWWENYDHDFSRVIYGIKLYQYNVWGRNQTLTLTAQFGFQKRFEMMYRIPYIDKRQKQGLILEMDYVEAKNVPDSTVDHKLDYFKYEHILRDTRGIGLTYTYRNNFYVQHRLKYEFRETHIADTLQKLNPNYLGPEKKRQVYDAATYEFVSDHRDVFAYPLKGYQIYLTLKRTGIGLQDDVSKTEASLSVSGHLELNNNFYLSNMAYFYTSTPNELPYYNYGALGYRRIFIRGYEVYVIEGPHYFLNKLTFKKRIFSRVWKVERSPIPQFNHFPLAIYLKTYADVGYINNYPEYKSHFINTQLSDKLLGGGGFGIDFVSAYDVVVRVEYTFTSQQTSGFFFHLKKEF